MQDPIAANGPFSRELARFQVLYQSAPQGEVTALEAYTGEVRHFVVYVDRTERNEQLSIQYCSGSFEVVIDPAALDEYLVRHLGYFLQGRCRQAAFRVATDVQRVCEA